MRKSVKSVSPLHLTSGDLEVFRWLWMLRVLTLQQIRRLRYYQSATGQLSSADNVRKRLARLKHAGYLSADLLQTSKERLYFLAARGLAALRDHDGLDQKRLYKPRSAETLVQLQHPLMVSECAVRLVESLRGTAARTPTLPPLSLPFYHTHAVANPRARKHVERFVTQEDVWVPGRPDPYRIRPDLTFALATGSAARLFFLEADRGFEGLQELGRKLAGYAAYCHAPDPQAPECRLWQRYGQEFVDFRVLLVTTSARRITNLLRALADQPGRELAAFTTAAQLAEGNFVRDAIWTVGKGEERALLPGNA